MGYPGELTDNHEQRQKECLRQESQDLAVITIPRSEAAADDTSAEGCIEAFNLELLHVREMLNYLALAILLHLQL